MGDTWHTPMEWHLADEYDPGIGLGPGVTYLRAETLDGRLLASAPLGSAPPPWPEGGWRVRQVTT